jgi:hypothetical protein
MSRVDPRQALKLAQSDPAAFATLTPAEQVQAARQQRQEAAGAPAQLYNAVTQTPPAEPREAFETLFARKVREAALSREIRKAAMYGGARDFRGWNMTTPDQIPQHLGLELQDEEGLPLQGISWDSLSDAAKERLRKLHAEAQAQGTLGIPGYETVDTREAKLAEELAKAKSFRETDWTPTGKEGADVVPDMDRLRRERVNMKQNYYMRQDEGERLPPLPYTESDRATDRSLMETWYNAEYGGAPWG